MSFLYLDLNGLGNWPQMLDNGPHLSSWDVLSLGCLFPGMFCPQGRFLRGTFCLGTFCLGTFCMCISKTTRGDKLKKI